MKDKTKKPFDSFEITPTESPLSKGRSRNYLEQVRPASSPHLDKLGLLLEEDWADEPNTSTHIYIGKNSATDPPRSSASKSTKEPSKAVKVITAVTVVVVAVIEVLRELELIFK